MRLGLASINHARIVASDRKHTLMFDPLQIPNVWRAESLSVPTGLAVPSEFSALDSALGGGWPTPALIELLLDVHGIGELQLVLPLLRRLSDASPLSPLILWLNPPYQPYVVALAQHGLLHVQHWLEMNLSARDTLWCIEQALRSGACAAVLAWISSPKTTSLRRLKLAVAASRTTVVLYRPLCDAALPSPATIRARLSPRHAQLHISLIKLQGRKSCELSIDVGSCEHSPRRLR